MRNYASPPEHTYVLNLSFSHPVWVTLIHAPIGAAVFLTSTATNTMQGYMVLVSTAHGVAVRFVE